MLLNLLLLACGGEMPGYQEIVLDEGTYYAVPPAGWDGESPLPATMHFHGYGGSASQYYDNEDAVTGFSDAGLLFLVPEGEGGSWRYDTAGDGRDDLDLVHAMLDDAAERWPLDTGRIYATGFSAGAGFAAFLGCEQVQTFAAVAPVSGGFFLPAPESCPGDPIPIAHTHGTADTTWPLEGRCFRYAADGSCDGGQVPMDENLAIWRAHLGCSEVVTASGVDGPQTCETWGDCAGGAELQLCLHDEGHTRLDGWSARLASWLLRFNK